MNDSNLCPEVSESGFHPEVVVAQAANPTPPEASHLCTSLFLPPSLSPLKFHHSSMQARSKGIKLDSSPLTSPSPTKSPAPPRSLSPSCSAPLPLFPAPPLVLRWTYLPLTGLHLLVGVLCSNTDQIKQLLCLKFFSNLLAFLVKVAQSCPTLYNPMDCSLPGSSTRGILQARILEWVVIPFSRGIFLTQGLNLGLLHCRQILYCHQGSPRPTFKFSNISYGTLQEMLPACPLCLLSWYMAHYLGLHASSTCALSPNMPAPSLWAAAPGSAPAWPPALLPSPHSWVGSPSPGCWPITLRS